MPIDRSSLTECWVGFVFSSPAAGIQGISVRCHIDGVVARQVVAELPDRLEKRHGLDIADRSTDLAQTKS